MSRSMKIMVVVTYLFLTACSRQTSIEGYLVEDSKWKEVKRVNLVPATWLSIDRDNQILGKEANEIFNLAKPHLRKILVKTPESIQRITKNKYFLSIKENLFLIQGPGFGLTKFVNKPVSYGIANYLKTPKGLFALIQPTDAESPQPVVLYRLENRKWRKVLQSNYQLNSDHARVNWIYSKSGYEIIWTIPNGICRAKLAIITDQASCKQQRNLENNDAIIITNNMHTKAYLLDFVSKSNVVSTVPSRQKYRMLELDLQ